MAQQQHQGGQNVVEDAHNGVLVQLYPVYTLNRSLEVFLGASALQYLPVRLALVV